MKKSSKCTDFKLPICVPHLEQVGFDSNRSTLCFNGQYRSGVDNDCILMSRGSADRGALTVLTREIPTGSGIHKLLPNLKHAGKCVNVIPLKDGQDSDVSVNMDLTICNILKKNKKMYLQSTLYTDVTQCASQK